VKRSAAASLLAVGFFAMIGQVALLRELAVASFGVELMFLAGTALWLAAGAAGALAGAGRARGGAGAIAAGFGLLALLLLPEAAFLRGARNLLGGVPGAYLPLGQQVATAAIGLMPAGALLGWLFRRGAGELAAAGGSLAAAYAWESVGGALGSVAATAALSAGASNLSLLVGCSVASALVAARPAAGRRWAVALAAALAALLPLAPELDRRTTAWNHPLLAHVADTPYGRVAVVRSQGQVAVFENDALSYDSEGTEPESLVHAAALQVREGARVLVLEGATSGLVREVLKHRPSRVVGVEVNEALHRALWPYLPEAERAALGAPGVELRFEDPRAFLLGGTDRFDLVLVGAPEPSSGQTNRFYTVEFFRRCAARLAPGGVVAIRLPSSENFWTPGQLLRNGAVHAALGEAFRDVLVLPGSSDVMLASASPLVRDAAVLGARLRGRGVATREVTPEYLRYLLTNDRAREIARLLASSGASANSDARPVCYQQTALLWLGRITGGAQRARLPGRSAALGALGAIAALVLAAAALRRGRRVALIGNASMVGMMIEAVVLLRYQAEAGALYRDIGLLLTSFMVGLAVGAGAYDRARARAGPARSWWGAIPVAGLALLAAGLAASIRAGQPTGLASSAALLVATGAAVAAVFAAASRPGGDEAGAGALYAADLVGGCAGSLLAVGLLVLVLGVDGTALGAAGLAAVSLVLLP
jgi:spermidine synthase